MTVRGMLAALLAVAAIAAPAAEARSEPVAHAACSSAYTPATIGGAHKCLHAGEYCATRYQSQYRRYGYECSRSYSPPRLRRR